MDITQEIEKYFDVPRIFQDIIDKIYADPAFDVAKFNWHNQISLRESSDWFEGTGSLYDYSRNEFVDSTSNYTTTSSKLGGTYLASVIETVESMAAIDDVKIGRVRILRLLPKTCYTLHADSDEFRYHIPLTTNDGCFFVAGDRITKMPTVGQLYRFQTDEKHTAVNASTQSRTHIVFDTFK